MDAGNELLRRAAVNPQVLQWHTWAALKPGPSLVVLGAVHGNETCGAYAILRAIDDLQHGRLLLRRGRLTLVPVANPLAFGQRTREGERNLNRRFMPRDDARDYEDHITRQLAPVLASHEALLDLHSFHTPGEPFAMVGPRNNEGTREPFMRAQEESELARALGVNQIVEGWLDVYDRASRARGKPLDDEGIGTTEYMRSQGGYAVTIECGQHDDPAAIRVAEHAIRGALALLGMADVPAPPRFSGPAARLQDVVLRESAADQLAREWNSFDVVRAGDLIARRADGREVRAAYDGSVLFPYPEAAVGQEWFYLAVPG
ncbi:succinylglutamate desuccinylase/aspartoacylase domain-containing protein [Ottowia caeni]|uniref:succinylglutamate desuccinylase/aspartoacylase family protein n=1 Tax=Ottowia caeni TaxID=2870339 RepID=UPI001E372F4D|nr:succinylglutamate desuccinylase/aspartoacylase family protein [Ottowia caeni]